MKLHTAGIAEPQYAGLRGGLCQDAALLEGDQDHGHLVVVVAEVLRRGGHAVTAFGSHVALG